MAKKTLTRGELIESLFALHEVEYDDGTYWNTDVGYFKIWRDFLCISESYELATQEYWGELSHEDVAALPEDFDRVRETFNDFGYLVDTEFAIWWLERGMRICGTKAAMPRTTVVATFNRDNMNRLDTSLRMDDYIQSEWRQQGEQDTIVVAIPLGLDQSRVIREVKTVLKNAGSENHKIEKPTPKYTLYGKRKSIETIMKYFRAVVVRAYFPEWDLVQVGLEARISATYNAARMKKGDKDDRDALRRETSKAINRGWQIAENAARGIFPDYRKCEHAVEPDFEEIRHRFEHIEKVRRREAEQRKKDALSQHDP